MMEKELQRTCCDCDMQDMTVSFDDAKETTPSEAIAAIERQMDYYQPIESAEKEREMFLNQEFESIVMRHCHYVCWKLKKRMGVSSPYFADAYQDCMALLSEKVREFDVTYGNRFISFVDKHIDGVLNKAVCRDTTTLKLQDWKNIGIIKKAKAEFVNQNYFEPSYEDLAWILKSKGKFPTMGEDKLIEYIAMVLENDQKGKSIDGSTAPFDDEQESGTLGDLLSDNRWADEALEQADNVRYLKEVLRKVVGDRDADILFLNTDYGADFPVSKDVLARRYHVTVDTINDILKRIKKKMAKVRSCR